MKEKISLSLKLKERVLTKNISLNSLSRLPQDIYKKLPNLLNNFLLVYSLNIYKPELKILSDEKLLLKRVENLPYFNEKEILLLILPFSETRFIFQTKILEETPEGYILEIQDPRTEERITLKSAPPVFLYFISSQYVQALIKNPDYHLLRETNFMPDNVEPNVELEEIHVYDLIIDSTHKIDETFRKILHKPFLVGKLKDFSKGGACIEAAGRINLDSQINLFYINFGFPLLQKECKLGLFCQLKDLSYKDEKTYFHLAFLVELHKNFWDFIKRLLIIPNIKNNVITSGE